MPIHSVFIEETRYLRSRNTANTFIFIKQIITNHLWFYSNQIRRYRIIKDVSDKVVALHIQIGFSPRKEVNDEVIYKFQIHLNKEMV